MGVCSSWVNYFLLLNVINLVTAGENVLLADAELYETVTFVFFS